MYICSTSSGGPAAEVGRQVLHIFTVTDCQFRYNVLSSILFVFFSLLPLSLSILVAFSIHSCLQI